MGSEMCIRDSYWFLLPASSQTWFETTRFVYFVKLKHVSRTLFNLKLQRTAFRSKNAPKKCSQSSPRAPKTSPKCLQELLDAIPSLLCRECGARKFERPAATSADPEKRSCSTANLALRQKKHKLFTGFGYRILFKCDLKQHALYTS